MELILGDCVEVMAAMEESSIDAIVTDPPYGLEFMGKEWDRLGGTVLHDPSEVGGFQDGAGGNPYSRSRIRYGQGEAQQAWHQQWAEQALRVLKPGGHLLAFGGSRTYHRMASAVEDAGFEIRDQLMWLYAQGFPKSHNLDGEYEGIGTALKPAHEPIVLARKPLVGTVASNVQEHGTGGLNIDACRIDYDGEQPSGWFDEDERVNVGFKLTPGKNSKITSEPKGGRWPANVLLDPGAGQLLDEQTGDLGSGGASRFFYCAKASPKERHAGLAGKNTHPTVKPVDLMCYLIRLVTSPGGIVLDPFMGSGTTGIAAEVQGFEFIGIELDEESFDIAERRIAHWRGFA